MESINFQIVYEDNRVKNTHSYEESDVQIAEVEKLYKWRWVVDYACSSNIDE